MLQSRRKWQNFLIRPSFQAQILTLIAFSCLIQMSIFYFFIENIFGQIEQSVAISNGTIQISSVDMLASEKAVLYFWLTQGLVFSLFVSLILGLLITHRAAGVLYRMKMDFQSMEQNSQLAPIRLRKYDFFQDVVDQYNKMIAKVSEDEKY